MSDEWPCYLRLHEKGLLANRADAARNRMRCCDLCPHRCGIDRLAGETGFCRTGAKAWVASYAPHFGEETPLVGHQGSGTIFFSRCNLDCRFCQNYEISHEGAGHPVTAAQLADMMLRLQGMGCHNVNLVSPSHVVPQILAALDLAASKGLRLPLVYNTGGYDTQETLALLDGVVDIYMPDFKFWDPASGSAYCGVADYPAVARQALLAMHGQVGDLVSNEKGIARRGMIVRHLVMPGGIAETRAILAFIANQLSRDTYVNLMPQYRPCGRANEIPALSRSLSSAEFEAALSTAWEAGLRRLD